MGIVAPRITAIATYKIVETTEETARGDCETSML